MPIRVKHHIKGYHALRSAPGIVADLEGRGEAVLNAVGGEAAGYSMGSQQGAKRPQGRWRVSVAAVTAKAKRDNAKHNTLLRGIDAAR
ncbi:hypothetical protein GS462_11230 [Rhodococcus hoagii]|nr:hypothetical protein [Prescottella equi]MBM4650984.1 hypothetical protein [Prescottella equi]MBM4686669.1 hypothetical protein [Prescottella equi]